MYLVDTNVISAATRAAANPALVRWMDINSDDLFLSTIAIAEIEDGITKVRREGGKKKADDLRAWLDTVLHLYGARILTFDISTALVAGKYADLARSKGRTVGFADVAIAATAKAQNLALLTRNTKDFALFDIRVHDPYEALPKR